MGSILDSFPYPWGRPEARRLHEQLTEAFPDVQDAKTLAATAGLDQYALNTNQDPKGLWREILDTAAKVGLTRVLAQTAHDRLAQTAPLRVFLAERLAEKPPAGGVAQPRRREPDARLRLAGVLDHHRVVGGRGLELGKLDDFIAAARPQHLVLTGLAGMGKTALLAEWVRRLDARSDVDVIYYFVNRQHGTATYSELLSTLLAQAVAVRGGEPPRAGTDIHELEVGWLQELQPGWAGVRRRPMVVVIDGVDEAEAAGWRLPHLLLPPVMAADVHMVVSARVMADRDWPRALGLDDAEELSVGGLDKADVADLLAVAGVPDWVRGPEPLATLMERTGGDPFYLRFLIDALNGRARKKIMSPAGLLDAPAGLTGYLKEIWKDAGGSAQDTARLATLGYLCVAKGPITAEELSEIEPADQLTVAAIGEVLDEVGRVVVVDPTSGGISLAHWRLQEIVAAALLSRRDRATRQGALLGWCTRWREHRSPHAVTYAAAYQIESGDTASAAELLADDEYQKLRVEGLGDPDGLFGDLDLVLRVETGRATPDVITVVGAALAVGDARTLWSRPETVFELAAGGDAEQAAQRLALLGSPPWSPWQRGAQIVLAWTVSGRDGDAARELLDSAVHQPGGGPLEALLAARVRHALGDGPDPELRMWFPPYSLPPADRTLAVAVMDRTTGQGVTHWEVSGLRDPGDYAQDNETGAYLAEDEAPWLVAYARDEPDEGDAWLESYIEGQAGNPYAMYRNRALWSVLAAVCCLPDAEQALRHAVHVTQAAFAPSPVRFTEFAHLAAVASAGRTSAVMSARAAATRSAAAVVGLGELGDQWGHHVRRLAAHAETAAVVLDDRAAARALLDAARALPRGYAGYRAPAHLAMAETCGIMDDDVGRLGALDQALRSAHNIQEPAYCAFMTARVNTLAEWWDAPLPQLPALVSEFVAAPEGARFGPRHRMGEPFRYRDHHDHIKTDRITHARNIQELAFALDVAPTRLADLNRRRLDSTVVVLPDPEFAPILAAWLSARVATADLLPPDRIRLTAALVPIATADPTALDLVLGRWVCALGPAFEGLPALITSLARRSTVDPAGGGQAGVA